MHLVLITTVILLFIRVGAQDEPMGIDSEEGDAEEMYNKTYIEHQTQLERTIFRGYRSKMRPVKNASTPTSVDVHWHLIHVSINQEQQTMTLHGHLYMTWMDELLGWDADEFNGIRITRAKKWQVWNPKIRVANSVSGVYSNFEISNKAHVLIQTHGKDVGAKVEMYPTFSIKVGCNFDYSAYPNDINACAVSVFAPERMSEVMLNVYENLPVTLAFGWGSQESKMIISDFLFTNFTTSMAYYRHTNFTSLAPITAQERASTWSVLRIELTFQRHSALFGISVLVPSSVAMIFNILPFFLPSVTLGLYSLVANTIVQAVFLQDLFGKLPLVVHSLPKSVCLYGETMVLNMFGISVHILLLILQNKKGPPPPFLSFVLQLYAILPRKGKIEDSPELSWKIVGSVLRMCSVAIIFSVYFISIIVFSF